MGRERPGSATTLLLPPSKLLLVGFAFVNFYSLFFNRNLILGCYDGIRSAGDLARLLLSPEIEFKKQKLSYDQPGAATGDADQPHGIGKRPIPVYRAARRDGQFLDPDEPPIQRIPPHG